MWDIPIAFAAFWAIIGVGWLWYWFWEKKAGVNGAVATVIWMLFGLVVILVIDRF